MYNSLISAKWNLNFLTIFNSFIQYPQKDIFVFSSPNTIWSEALFYTLGDKTRYFLLILSLLFVMLYKIGFKYSNIKLLLSIFVALSLFVTYSARYIQTYNRINLNKNWIDLQYWISINTLPKDTFIADWDLNLYESFSTLTRRSRISTNSFAGFLYSYSKSDHSFDVKKLLLGPSIDTKKMNADLITNYYKSAASLFDASYLVLSAEYPELPLTITYRNSQYVLYSFLKN